MNIFKKIYRRIKYKKYHKIMTTAWRALNNPRIDPNSYEFWYWSKIYVQYYKKCKALR